MKIEGLSRQHVLFSFILLGISFFFCCPPSSALSPSNAGFAGLWEYPTAEMPDDGAGWVGTSWYYPYRSMYANLAWLPWLEVNLRLTEFETGPLISPGYGRYKDKALDLKLLLQKQKNFIPSLAGGVLDVVGTEIMKSWYGVATWRFDNWAFSAGYGTDRLNGFFGGVQYDVSPWLEFKAEYSPLDYTRDKTSNVYIHPDPADQKYNLGFVAKTDWGGDFSLSYQRGEELSFGFSYAFDCNNPPFFKFGKKSSKEKELPVPGKPGVPDWDNTDPEKLAADIFQGLEECVKVRDVEILMGDRTLLVAYENIGYASDAEALARVFAVVANVAPWDMDTLSLVPRLRGVPVVRADFPGSQAALLRMGRISRYDASEAHIAWAPSGTSRGERPEESWRLQSHAALRKRGQSSFKIMVVYEPRIDRTLEEDYMNRWSLDAIYQWRSSRGWEAIFDVRLPLENTIDIYWEPETNDDVRIWKGVYSYLKELENLPLGEKSFLLAEAGWVDENWFGLNLWERTYFGNGRWWLGARASVVRYRDPYSFGGFEEVPEGEDAWTAAGWLQAGYRDPTYQLEGILEWGRFLDKDQGAAFTLTRWWNDIGVGFWISRTDVLTPGKNFSNAGMTLAIPAEAWFGDQSSHTWYSSFTLLSTWEYNAARSPGYWKNPERLMGQLQPEGLQKNLYQILENYCEYYQKNLLIRENRAMGLLDVLGNRNFDLE